MDNIPKISKEVDGSNARLVGPSSCPIQAAVATAAAIASSSTTELVNNIGGTSYSSQPQQPGHSATQPIQRDLSRGNGCVGGNTGSTLSTSASASSTSSSTMVACQSVAAPASLTCIASVPLPDVSSNKTPPIIPPTVPLPKPPGQQLKYSTTSSVPSVYQYPGGPLSSNLGVQASPALQLASGMVNIQNAPLYNGMVGAATGASLLVGRGHPVAAPVPTPDQRHVPQLHQVNPYQMPVQVPQPFSIPQVSSQSFIPPEQLLQYRSGKWTSEEEEYASILIEMFERGHVPEEKNGVTLRSFLSRKLLCAPMRISKKYSGRGIGKKTYLNKVSTYFSNGSRPVPPDIQADISRTKTAEIKFLNSAFPGWGALAYSNLNASQMFWGANGFASAPIIIAPATPSPISSRGATTNAVRKVDDVNSIPVPGHTNYGTVPVFSASNPGMVSFSPASTLSQPLFLSMPTGGTAVNSATLPSSIPSNNAVQFNTAASKGTHETHDGIDTTRAPNKILSPDPSDQNSLHGSVDKFSPEVYHSQNKDTGSRAAGAVDRLREAYVNTILRHATAVAVDHNKKDASPAKTNLDCEATGNGTNHNFTRSPIVKVPSRKTKDRDSLPDFLSGFDNASGKTGVDYRAPIGEFDPYSPTYTTDSFDDLHQFLGKNLTPLIANGPSYGSVDSTPIIPQIHATASRIVEKRIPHSTLRMRPLGGDRALVSRSTGDRVKAAIRSAQILNPSNSTSRAPPFSVPVQGCEPTENQNISFLPSPQTRIDDGGREAEYLDSTEHPSSAYPSFFLESYNSAMVSDPSDLASDDVNSGNESGNFGDSDEAQSEGSSHRRKRAKISGEDDEDDVRSWYNTLVKD